MTNVNIDGFYSYPTLHGDTLVFVSEDDLWSISLRGGSAVRLTNLKGGASYASFSPDGLRVAFTGKEEGSREVYVLDMQSGKITKLTHLGAMTSVVGWTGDEKHILFRSNHQQPIARSATLFKVSIPGGEAINLGLGEARWFSESKDGRTQVLGRFSDDIARWKRYKGGTAGVMWVKKGKQKWVRILEKIQAGVIRPMIINKRIYFISDMKGYGELYSSNFDGSEIKKHTRHHGFYPRHAMSDGERITYSCGGDLYIFDASTGKSKQVKVDYKSSRQQMARKFPSSRKYLSGLAVHPGGVALAAITRGKLFAFSNWEGGVHQLGAELKGRMRNAAFLNDGKRIVAQNDESGEEVFYIFDTEKRTQKVLQKFDYGRILEFEISPTHDVAIAANHRYELLQINLKSGRLKKLDRSEYGRITGLSWSADGQYVAYAKPDSERTSKIRVVNPKKGVPQDITTGEFNDYSPSFDPEGRYIYFITQRFFEPSYDAHFFSIGFPKAAKPALVALKRDTENPFIDLPPRWSTDDEEEEKSVKSKSKKAAKTKAKKKKEEDEDTPKKISIDFENIDHRVSVFPVDLGHYSQIEATDKKVFWTVNPEEGESYIQSYKLEDRKLKYLVEGWGFSLSRDRSKMLVISSSMRMMKTGETPDEEDGYTKRTGWIDLSRIVINIDQRKEWRQMFRETWRLMRDHFWRKDMSGVDWKGMWERYRPLVERVNTRAEYSDLVWLMQGELGTSHAYEYGGDHRNDAPRYLPGFLGADIKWDRKKKAFHIERIIRGDSWDRRLGSPLSRVGVDIKEGYYIKSVNGVNVSKTISLQEMLANKGNDPVSLGILGEKGKSSEVVVTPLKSETGLRYREWVTENRKKVHASTKGKVGYVHIPDMSVEGFAEFHRGFLSELRRDALIVDVRFNGGGHVSQMLLEKLARKRIGYDIPRWGKPIAYPADSMIGPMIAITNETAGSDGDIFSHCFKLMDLGTLIGKRTWGGVIGIWPRHALVDRSQTSQPEFSHWFEDVGFGVENYGTDPDIEVDISPDDYKRGYDPQLARALKEIKKSLKEEKPAIPDFGEAPNLAPPGQKKHRRQRKS